MTTREQQLWARIRQGAIKWEEPEGERGYAGFMAGANSLLPLVLEMAEALEKYRHIGAEPGISQFSQAERTLSSLDRFLEEGK